MIARRSLDIRRCFVMGDPAASSVSRETPLAVDAGDSSDGRPTPCSSTPDPRLLAPVVERARIALTLLDLKGNVLLT